MDQFRADCIEGVLGEHVELPHIRALQKEALTFSRCFSVTNPCGPSRASIFTGLYAMNHRSVRNGTPLSADITNLALEARKGSYEPLLFGYTDTSRDPRTRPEDDPDLRTEENVLPGFREVVEMRYQESFPWRADLKAKGYKLPDFSKFYHPVPSEPGQPARLDDAAFYKAEDSDTAFLTNRFIEEMAVRTDRNWFALLTYIRPHPPLVAPVPYNRMYRGDELPLPVRMNNAEDEAAVHPFLKAAQIRPSLESIAHGFEGRIDAGSDADVQTLRATYLGLASEVDFHIGRVVEFLKETGQYEETLIVLMADHGEMLGDHHMWGKHNVYEQAFRIPLIIRDPGNPAQHGAKVEALVESIDVTPTILDLMGRDVPRAMNGVSLRPFIEGERPEVWRDCVHLELDYGEPDKPTIWQNVTGTSLHEANVAILREERFKLVHFNGGLAPLLYDLENDPDEMNDLAGDPAHAETLLRLTQKLLSLRMRHLDRTLADVKITPDGPVSFGE